MWRLFCALCPDINQQPDITLNPASLGSLGVYSHCAYGRQGAKQWTM